MKQIQRFSIDINATTIVLEMPKGAQITELGHDPMRGGNLSVWAIVDPENELEQRTFYRVCTGEPILHDTADLEFVARTVGLGASQSNPGHLTPRTVHFFEAKGQAREAILAIADAVATA